MSAELTSKIAEIIRKRKEIADEPKWEKERLDSLYAKISDLERRRQQFMRSPSNNTDLIEGLKDINFPKILLFIEQEQQVWKNLWKRFSRDTLNIGVAGLARQGKSTLLQSLTGLTDDEIPSSDRMPCTSVQSNIYHISDGETYALVYFYSESSFLKEVIAPYYQKLGFASPPKSLAEFRQPLPPQPANLPNPAETEAIYTHLHDDYHAHIDKYSNLLQPQERVVKIAKNVIKKFVSQEYDAQGNPLNFNHLAVRKVEIFCPFPKIGVEKIGLIDTVGLGDTRLGDRERMIKALGQDTDFILFVRRPAYGGDLWGQDDTKLHDAAYQALKHRLLLEEWSFMVLNYDGNNQKQCQDLENTRLDKGIRVCKCVTANCIDSTQANSILEEAIDYLIDNLVRLDTQYMSACKSSLKGLQSEITTELEKARQALEQYGEEHGEYVKLRDQFMKNLYNKVEELRHKYRQEPTQSDPHFQRQVDTAIENCQKHPGIPSEEAIKNRLNQDGIDAAYFWSIQQMRTKLLRNFHLIETGLKESLETKKVEVADVFCQLGISEITQEKGTAFLKVMAEQIPTNLSNLKLGFQFLSTFDILYKGFIQSIVWTHLSKSLPPNTNIPISTPPDVKSIQEHLNTRHKEAVDSCKQALNILALAPSEIGCSMVEEFSDHITRAEGVQQEWDIFLGTKRSQIWPQLKELEQRKQIQQEWIALVDEVMSINQKRGN
ncbi:hypothetical protein [Aerosakkonema funiforme]|uniref:hypothetical protein n=1 Tax=Aerosakkonema funiforme TaxID=1246630 RepID=UPI0035BB575D